LTRAYYHTFGLPITTSNCSNNYGPYQFPEKLIPLIITNALLGLTLPIYGDGCNVRDWLFVEDHCYGIDLVLNKGQIGETYNIGGNNELCNIDITKLVCRLLDEEFARVPALQERFPGCPAAHAACCQDLISFVPDRLGHDRRYAVNTMKIEKDLGYSPLVSFDHGIKRTIHWYLENETWWRKL
jgi:dTDP-glucose 4,6-dehydratase